MNDAMRHNICRKWIIRINELASNDNLKRIINYKNKVFNNIETKIKRNLSMTSGNLRKWITLSF